MPTVTVIQPIITKEKSVMIRCAAYCRVSSDSEDQLNSFMAQTRYYSQVFENSETEILVDIYADEGVTGIREEKRDDFQELESTVTTLNGAAVILTGYRLDYQLMDLMIIGAVLTVFNTAIANPNLIESNCKANMHLRNCLYAVTAELHTEELRGRQGEKRRLYGDV